MVINADTGERQPIWAELDSNPTGRVDPGADPDDPSDDVPGGINENPTNTGDVNLIIRPAENFDFEGHYIVALRNLRNATNQPIEAPIGFKVYRDNDITDQPEVEARRPHMESLIDTLETKAGVDRNSLYMAWDFTVASQESVTGRATTIRDDAFERLGDTDLANRTIEGDSPAWDITRVLNQGDVIPDGERGLDTEIARRVEGTIDVPCYLDTDNCPTGAEFAHDPDGSIKWNPAYRRDVEFRCEIPKSVDGGGHAASRRGRHLRPRPARQRRSADGPARPRGPGEHDLVRDGLGGLRRTGSADRDPGAGRHVAFPEDGRPDAAGLRQLHVPGPGPDP